MTQRILGSTLAQPLPADEQLRLAREYQKTKDSRIERRLVETNLRLVTKLAHQLDKTHGRFLDDLIQEGCLGLVEGIRRFEPRRGVHLSTYATFWIRAFIVRYQMNNVRLVRAVRTRADRAAFFKGKLAFSEVSFDAPLAPDRSSLAELMADPSPRADDWLETIDLARKVRRSAAIVQRRLCARDATVLRERLLAETPMPLRSVAKRVSLSGERVRQVEIALRAAIQRQIERAPRDWSAYGLAA